MVFAGLVSGQDITDFYFNEAMPANEPALSAFPSEFRGSYYLQPDSSSTLLITDTTVAIRTKILFTTTREKLLEKENVRIEKGEIHGLKQGLALPYIMDNQTIYFYYPHDAQFFQISSMQVVKRANDGLLLNYEEKEGLWSAISLRFTKQSMLEMAAIDYSEKEEEINAFKRVDSTVDGDVLTIIARPSDKEIGRFIEKGGFTDSMNYTAK